MRFALADIDFDEGRLFVRHTKTQNGRLVIEADQTKTDKSKRTIDLIESTVPYLRELRETQTQNGLTLDKVCVWTDGREVRPDFLTRHTGQLIFSVTTDDERSQKAMKDIGKSVGAVASELKRINAKLPQSEDRAVDQQEMIPTKRQSIFSKRCLENIRRYFGFSTR